jgi:hypothetical protein
MILVLDTGALIQVDRGDRHTLSAIDAALTVMNGSWFPLG